MPLDKFGRMSDTKTKDSGVSLTYINNNYIRSDGNSRITGNLDMGGSTIENLGRPRKPKDAVTKEYVNRFFIDNIPNNIELKHIIAVNARYCGELIAGDYQFTFSGASFFKPCEEQIEKNEDFKGSTTGFLMPHSGRIKKINVEGLVYISRSNFIQELEDEIVKLDILDEEELIIFKENCEKYIEDMKKKIKEEAEDIYGELKEELRSRTIFNAGFGTIIFNIVKFEKKYKYKTLSQ